MLSVLGNHRSAGSSQAHASYLHRIVSYFLKYNYLEFQFERMYSTWDAKDVYEAEVMCYKKGIQHVKG